jgi:hypothetical protein
LLADLDLLARGEPPHYAEQSLGHDVFATLAQGEAQEIAREQLRSSRGGPPLAVTIVLSLVLVLSVLMNIILAGMLGR